MGESKRAVVIGLNEYRDEAIPKLQGCENDARELYARLSDPNSGGFSIDEKRHLLLGKTATCQAIREAISDLLWEPEPCGFSLFYFSGHGFRDGYGNGYIAPWDIERDMPFVCGVRMQELTDLLQRTVAKERILVVLDCCYSGIAATGAKAGSATDPPPLGKWFEGLNNTDTGKGKIIFASSGKDRTSSEIWLDPALPGYAHTFGLEGQAPTRHCHGEFTFHLLEGLDGKAATKGGDGVTVQGLWNYVYGQMKKDHPPTLWGGGFGSLEEEDKIVVSRASMWRSIDTSLDRVDVWRDGPPRAVFRAAIELGKVMGQCAKLDRATDLKEKVDTRLKEYWGPALAWLNQNQFDFDPNLGSLVDSLRKLVARLSVDIIRQQDKTSLGLLASLCVVSSEASGAAQDYTLEDFKRDLSAAWSQSQQGMIGVSRQSISAAGGAVGGSQGPGA